jgi:hypothetical protein
MLGPTSAAHSQWRRITRIREPSLEELQMFPVTSIDIVSTERSRRLEGYRTWSRRRHQTAGADADDVARPEHGHHPVLRPAFGR